MTADLVLFLCLVISIGCALYVLRRPSNAPVTSTTIALQPREQTAPEPHEMPAQLGPAPEGKRWKINASGVAVLVDVERREPAPAPTVSTCMHDFELAYKHAEHAIEIATEDAIPLAPELLALPDQIRTAMAHQTAAQVVAAKKAAA